MSSTETDLLESEVQLGKALALIHRVLPRLSESGWDSFVQDSLKGAIAQVEAARQSHEKEASSRKPMAGAGPARPQVVSPEILAVVAAAAHALFDQPFRIVSVHEAGESALQWSAEGRRLIFSSHRIR